MADVLLVNGEVIWEGDELFVAYADEAVRQQAYLRAVCDQGESMFYDEYGSLLFTYLGKPFTPSNKALVEASAKESLLQTEGIAEVVSADYRFEEVDGVKRPVIFAQYRLEGEEKAREAMFRFMI